MTRPRLATAGVVLTLAASASGCGGSPGPKPVTTPDPAKVAAFCDDIHATPTSEALYGRADWMRRVAGQPGIPRSLRDAAERFVAPVRGEPGTGVRLNELDRRFYHLVKVCGDAGWKPQQN